MESAGVGQGLVRTHDFENFFVAFGTEHDLEQMHGCIALGVVQAAEGQARTGDVADGEV